MGRRFCEVVWRRRSSATSCGRNHTAVAGQRSLIHHGILGDGGHRHHHHPKRVYPASPLAIPVGPGSRQRLVIVPAIGFATTITFGLALPEQVGVVLMAIAPGAPLALRRALASGADEGFAPTLQIAVAILAVPAVPLWVVVGNWILGTHGFIDAAAVARQVILAQLLPLAMGTIVKRVAPVRGARIGIALGRAAAILLLAALVSILVNVRYSILLTHFWPIVGVAIITISALVVGHLLGGPSPDNPTCDGHRGCLAQCGPSVAGRDDQSDPARGGSGHHQLCNDCHHHRINLHSVVDKRLNQGKISTAMRFGEGGDDSVMPDISVHDRTLIAEQSPS